MPIWPPDLRGRLNDLDNEVLVGLELEFGFGPDHPDVQSWAYYLYRNREHLAGWRLNDQNIGVNYPVFYTGDGNRIERLDRDQTLALVDSFRGHVAVSNLTHVQIINLLKLAFCLHGSTMRRYALDLYASTSSYAVIDGTAIDPLSCLSSMARYSNSGETTDYRTFPRNAWLLTAKYLQQTPGSASLLQQVINAIDDLDLDDTPIQLYYNFDTTRVDEDHVDEVPGTSTTIVVKSDPTAGCEITLGPATLSQYEAVLPRLMRLLDEGNAEPHSRAGIHVHLDANGLSNQQLIRWISSSLLLQGFITTVCEPHRYGPSAYNNMVRNGLESMQGINRRAQMSGNFNRTSPGNRWQLVNTRPETLKRLARLLVVGFDEGSDELEEADRSAIQGFLERNSFLNPQALRRHGTLEFRQFQASLDPDEVMNWMRLLVRVRQAAVTLRPRHLLCRLPISQGYLDFRGDPQRDRIWNYLDWGPDEPVRQWWQECFDNYSRDINWRDRISNYSTLLFNDVPSLADRSEPNATAQPATPANLDSLQFVQLGNRNSISLEPNCFITPLTMLRRFFTALRSLPDQGNSLATSWCYACSPLYSGHRFNFARELVESIREADGISVHVLSRVMAILAAFLPQDILDDLIHDRNNANTRDAINALLFGLRTRGQFQDPQFAVMNSIFFLRLFSADQNIEINQVFQDAINNPTRDNTVFDQVTASTQPNHGVSRCVVC